MVQVEKVIDLHTFSIALEAGQAAGGDHHADSVAELRRIWTVVGAHAKQIEAEYGPAAVRLFGRVKF